MERRDSREVAPKLQAEELLRLERVLERASGKGPRVLNSVVGACARLLRADFAGACVVNPAGRVLAQTGDDVRAFLEADLNAPASAVRIRRQPSADVAELWVDTAPERKVVFAFRWEQTTPVAPRPSEALLHWLVARLRTWFRREQQNREARTDAVIMRMFSQLGRYYAGGHTFQDVLRAFGRVVHQHLGLQHVCLGFVPEDEGEPEWLVRRGKLASISAQQWRTFLEKQPTDRPARILRGPNDLEHMWVLALPPLGRGHRFFAFLENSRNYDWERVARWIQLHASVVVRQRMEKQEEENRAAQLRALSRVSSFLDRTTGGVRVLLESLEEARRALNARAVWLQFPRATEIAGSNGRTGWVVGRCVTTVERRLQELAFLRKTGEGVAWRQIQNKRGETRRVLAKSVEYGGTVRGVLGVEWQAGAAPGAEAFVSELALQLALLLRDVEEVEEVRRRHRELVIANRVGSLATQLEDSLYAVQKALTLFVDASGYSGAILYQISEDGQALELVGTAGRWARQPSRKIDLPDDLTELGRQKKIRRAMRISPRGVVIPLYAYGRLVGMLAVESRGTTPVLVGQAGLDTVGRELALALENARLIQHLNKTLRLQTTLLRLSSALLDARDVESIVEAIGEAVSELYPCCWLAMGVQDTRTKLMKPCGKIWQNGKVIWSGEIAAPYRRLRNWNKRLQQAEVSSTHATGAYIATGQAALALKRVWEKAPPARRIWVVPCRVYGETQAYMLFGLLKDVIPSARQVRNMAVGARHAAMAISAALDLRRHQQEARRAAVIAELGRWTGANINAQDLGERALLALKNVLPYDLGSVTAVDLREKAVRVLAISGSKPLRVRPGDVFEASDSYLARVARSRKPLIIGNLALRRRRSRVDERILAYGIRSVINIPLIAQGRVFGSLNLGSFQKGYFSQEDLPFLSEVATQLSLSIANSELLENLSANLNYSRRLLRTWRFFSREDDAEKLVRYALRQIIRAFGGVGAFWIRKRAGRRCVRHVGLANLGIQEAELFASLGAEQKERICRTTKIRGHQRSFRVCSATILVPTVGSENTLGVLLDGRPKVNEAGAQNFLWTLASQLVAAVERARFVSTLRKSEENYRTLVQNLPIGLMLVDDQGIIRLGNRQAAELLGVSVEELESGRRFVEFFPTKDLGEWLVAGDSGQAHEGNSDGRSVEFSLTRADGRRLRVRATRESIREPFKGQLIGLIDITAQRELEKRAAEAEKLAAVGELAAAIAHEIRNPLAAITTSVSTLGDALEVNGEDRELMEIVLEESRRVSRVLDDFLRFSRMPKPRRELTDLNRLVRDVLRLYRLEVPEHVQLRLMPSDELPLVSVDSQLLKHVVVNLLQNAIDAVKNSSEGVVQIATGLETNDDGRQKVWIAVTDNGPGMPPEVWRKAFQPFFTTKPTGVGMGLPISDGIVRAHGGRIVLRSKEGQGTEARVYLPLEEEENERADDRSRAERRT